MTLQLYVLQITVNDAGHHAGIIHPSLLGMKCDAVVLYVWYFILHARRITASPSAHHPL